MQIEYNNRSIQKICTNASIAEKKYGTQMAERLSQRIDEIRSADSVEEMVKYKIGRCHLLKLNRKGQYAVDLVQPQRLIFEKKDNEGYVVNILEIIDYH